MATHAASVYAAPPPEVLEKRKKRQEELNKSIARMLQDNPKRKPAWDDQRLCELDKFALKHEKRCIMWDDEGAGFYLMLNWDWIHNRPAPQQAERALDPGWYANAKQMLKLPLLDVSLPEDQLAAWIDANTMQAHQFLGMLHKLRRDADGALVLDDPYWATLQAS